MTDSPIAPKPILHLTSDSFNRTVRSFDRAVIDFWAEWCGPCRRLSPVFEAVSKEFPEIRFCKCNTDDCPDIAQELFIFSIPTVLFIKDGKTVHIESGAMSEEAFRTLLITVFAEE